MTQRENNCSTLETNLKFSRAWDSSLVEIGDMVIGPNPGRIIPYSTIVGEVVSKSRYVFVVQCLCNSEEPIYTSYQYKEFGMQDGPRVVDERTALEYFRKATRRGFEFSDV